MAFFIETIIFIYKSTTVKPIKEITIYDIALKINKSSSTVSRALKDHPSINKITKQRIQEVAKELGYRHNSFASGLRKQKSQTIGLIVPSLNSSFMASVLTGIQEVTTEAGYDILITNSHESAKIEVANALNLFHKRVDGLLASLSFETESLDHFQPYIDRNIPIVFFDRVDEKSALPKVIIDNYKYGYAAVKHLIEQGCKRIAMITSNLNRNVYAQRFSGYKDALKDSHIEFNEKYLLIKEIGEKHAVAAAQEVMKMDPVPDGVFITSDFTAALFMQTLKEQGFRIPKDIAVVGFNNDAIGKIVEPQLTTIDYPGIDIGEIAARNLLALMSEGKTSLQINTVFVESKLIIRQSSMKKKSN